MRRFILLITALILVLGMLLEALLPTLLAGAIKSSLINKTGSSDIELSLATTPNLRMLLGDMDEIHGVMRQGKVGNIFVRELSLDATGARVAMISLLRDGRTHLLAVNEVLLKGVVDEDALKALITEKMDKFSNIAVKITPSGTLVSADAKLMGRTFALSLDGNFLIESGDLYFKAKKISASGGGLGKISVGSLFDDILVARSSHLPFELKFLTVEEREGVVILTAGK